MLGHWYLVASQKSVKIFTELPHRKTLKILKIFDNPLARERNRALVRKQAGRGMKSAGRLGVLHYTETKRHEPHEMAASQFAREIAEAIKEERRLKKFEHLTVVAEPRFLGKLRSAMGPELNELVVEWVKKDLQKTPQVELKKILLSKENKVLTN